MRTANPALSDRVFQQAGAGVMPGAERMTLQGTVNKCFLLVALAMGTAVIPWTMFFRGQGALAMPLAMGGAIAGLIVAIVLVFKNTWAPVLAPVYALLEGLLLGGVSAAYQSAFKGIVVQAAALTLFTLLALLLAYRSGLIKVTQNLRLGIVAATGGVMLVYVVGFIMSFFGKQIPLIHGSGIVGIGFSLLVVGIAAMNLVLDFDFIERGAENGAPKHMEWYAAFGLLVTLVWLYLEMLRLLAKLNRR